MYFPGSENKGADQLRGDREAELRLCFRIIPKSLFSHDEAHKSKDSRLCRNDAFAELYGNRTEISSYRKHDLLP